MARLFSLLSTVALALTRVVLAKDSNKVFIDNDGELQILMPLLGGYDVVGYSGSFGSASLIDSMYLIYNSLEELNITQCIPLYAGAEAPLLRTYDTFQQWEKLFGPLVWQGAFMPGYQDIATYDDISYDDSKPAALALIEAVKENPGEVKIFAAGLMTTVAQALSIYPKLAEEAAGLYVMGGYIDGQLAQATGGNWTANLFSDINLIQDPEAAQMVFTAPWDELVIAGNVTNGIFKTQEFVDEIVEKVGGMTALQEHKGLTALKNFVGNGTVPHAGEENLPQWDSVAIAAMVFEDVIKSSADVHVAVDTAFDSPFYGNMRFWSADLAPRGGVRTGRAKLITEVNEDLYFSLLQDAFLKDWTSYCTLGGPLDL